MKKLLSILFASALLAGVLTGCGSAGSGEAQASAGRSSSSAAVSDASQVPDEPVEVKQVVVGTAGRPKPFIYTDENNHVTGYEAEVIYAIDELLEEYEFEFEIASDTAAISTGLSAGIYDMAANNLSRTEEREQQFLYGDEYVGYSYTGAVVRIDDDSIQTLEDLGGKRSSAKVEGGLTQLFLEEYNEQHPDNPVELVYTSSVPLKVFQDLMDGAFDFTLETSSIYYNYAATYPEIAEKLKFVTFSKEETELLTDSPYSWYLFPQTDEGAELAAAVDGALRQLKEDGTLNEIAQEYLHYDVVE